MFEFHQHYTAEDPNCQDELPSDWKADVELYEGYNCGQLNCGIMSEAGACELSLKHFSPNCVQNTTVLVKEFCKKSCRNCSKL